MQLQWCCFTTPVVWFCCSPCSSCTPCLLINSGACCHVQTQAFHESLPLAALNSLAYTMFRAEVLDALKKKTKSLTQESFAMLVVEDASREVAASVNSDGSSSSGGDDGSSSSSSIGDGLLDRRNGNGRSGFSGGTTQKVVGVLEVSVQVRV